MRDIWNRERRGLTYIKLFWLITYNSIIMNFNLKCTSQQMIWLPCDPPGRNSFENVLLKNYEQSCMHFSQEILQRRTEKTVNTYERVLVNIVSFWFILRQHCDLALMNECVIRHKLADKRPSRLTRAMKLSSLIRHQWIFYSILIVLSSFLFLHQGLCN